MRSRGILIIVLCLSMAPAFQESSLWGKQNPVPYRLSPDWVSEADGQCSTGLAFADINGDGWKDMVVSNGNDIARQKLVVYYNRKDGTFPPRPDWESADSAFNGNLAVGDINRDGWLDVAVGIFTGISHTYIGGGAKVYLNRGTPDYLEEIPSWSVQGFPAFNVALGDANGDGWIDLAVAAGNAIPEVETFAAQPGCKSAYVKKDPYIMPMEPPFKEHGMIYFNSGKILNTVPGWRSDRELLSYDVEFADVNGDGFVDLIFADPQPLIYFGDRNGVIAAAHGWRSSPRSYVPIHLDYVPTLDTVTNSKKARVPSLVVADNNYMGGGEGRFKLFRFNSSYITAFYPRESSPSWASSRGGWGACVRFADIDNDGKVDLLTARWAVPGSGVLGAPLEIYLGNGIELETAPSFISDSRSVLETIALADLRNRGLRKKTEIFTMSGGSAVTLTLPVIEKVAEVSIDGEKLEPREYLVVSGENIVYLARPIKKCSTVTVTYYYSVSLDIGVTNWDCGIGNYIFYNTGKNL